MFDCLVFLIIFLRYFVGIDKGLELAADKLFGEEIGARPSVSKFLVVFSDGDFKSYHSVSLS